YVVRGHAGQPRCRYRGHSVEQVVRSHQRGIGLLYAKTPVYGEVHFLPVVVRFGLTLQGNTYLTRPDIPAIDLLRNNGIVSDIDEILIGAHVADEPEFRIGVFRHGTVPVQVVGRNVQQDSHQRIKGGNAVELKAAHLQHVPVVIAGSDLACKANAYVSGKGYFVSCFVEQVIGEQRGCRLTVGTGDGYDVAL